MLGEQFEGFRLTPELDFRLVLCFFRAGLLVTEWPGASNFGAIIGMDVIGFGDFAITNVGKQTWMSFRMPSVESIDYVAEHRKQMFGGTKRNAPCPCGSGQKYQRCHGAA